MEVTSAVAEGLGQALNESSWIAADIHVPEAVVDLVLDVLTLPESGPAPDSSRRLLRLTGVSRVVASYRMASWDDDAAPPAPLEPDALTQLIDDLGRLPIYGWEFIDKDDEQFDRWHNRLSFDVVSSGAGSHTLDLFQDGGDRILDFRAWFDELTVLDESGVEISLPEFIAGGTRWWDGMYAGDPRTEGVGIYPGAPEITREKRGKNWWPFRRRRA